MLTAQIYSAAVIIMIDLDDKRLVVAKGFGATNLDNSADGKAAEQVMGCRLSCYVDVLDL